MQTSNTNLISVVFVILFLSASLTHADTNHYINHIVGDRASGLAGAYTAVSDDTDGCYYNPAGIAIAPGNKFSASVSALNSSTKTYKGVLTQAGGGTTDWEQESFMLLPNYFGIVQKFGPGMAGFSYAVPDSVQRRQKQTFANIQSNTGDTIDTFRINMNDFDKAYLFGPTYALKLTDSLSVGGTLYYYYRDTQFIANFYMAFASGIEVINNSYITKTEHGWKPVLGLLWEPVDSIAIGLSMSKLWITDSDFERQNIWNTLTSPDDINLEAVASDSKDKQPYNTTLGLAWFYSPSLLLSCDLKYFEEIGDRPWVLNGALGAEYYPVSYLALRAGVYSDMSSTDDITANVPNTYDEHIDLFGTSFSVTLFSQRSSITLGLNYAFGSGDSQIIEGSYQVFDVDYDTLSVQVSTSFNY